MAFSGTPFMFDDPQQPTDVEKLEAKPLATEKTLQGIRMGNSIIQDDLGSINRKLSQSGDLYGILTDIADVLDNSSIARHSKSPLESLLENQHKEAEKWNISKGGSFLGIKKPSGTEAAEAQPSIFSKARAAISGGAAKSWGGIKGLFSKKPDHSSSASMWSSNYAGGKKGESAEDELEDKKADKKAAKVEKGQSDSLTGIWQAMKDRAKKSWFAENWKMLLAGLIFLFAPLKLIKKLWELVKTAWNFSKKHPIIAGLVALGVTLLGPMNLIKMAVSGLTSAFGLFSKSAMFKQGLGSGGMQKMVGGGMILAGLALAIKDGIAGSKLSSEWGVSKASGVAGAVLGGTSKGLEGAMSNMGKWALIGAGLGSFFPVVGTLIGGLIGAAVGALLGWIGGERIAKFFKSTGQFFSKIWKGLTDGIVQMVEDFNEFLIDPILDILSGMTKWVINKVKSLREFFGLGPAKKPIKDTGDYAEGPTPEEIKAKKLADEKARGGMKWKDFKMAEEKKFAASGGNAADWVKSVGGHKAAKALYKSSLSGGTVSGQGITADEPGLSTPPVSTSHPVQPSSIPHKTITTTPSGEDIHKAVKISNADMSGVSWNKLGGRDTIEGIILNTWNQAGISAAPTFTSGFRKKDAKESLANPTSKHIQKTAFDVRSKDLGSAAPGIFASLMDAFEPLGLWGQHEQGNVNKKNRTGEHFHFQLAARGFQGIVGKDGPRGFIAGEAGEELVSIQPLVSPDAKMNAMNALNTKNQTLQQGQSGSPVIINNTTNASASTANSTSLIPLPTTVHAPKLTTSLPG